MEVLRFLTGHEVGVRQYLETNEQPGARPDVWNDPRITREPEFKVFRQAMDTLQPHYFPYNFRGEEAIRLFEERVAPVLRNEAGVAATLSTLHSEMQRLLDEPRPPRGG